MIDQLDVCISFFSFLLDNIENHRDSQPLFSQAEKKKYWPSVSGLVWSANQRIDIHLIAEQVLAHTNQSVQLHTNTTGGSVAMQTA